MAVVRWDPYSDLFGIQRDLNELFQRAWGEPSGAPAMASRRRSAAYIPPVDVFGRDGSLVVCAELPGVRPEDVEVTVHNGVLTLRGERRHESKVDEGQYFRMESSYGSFERTIQLPDGVDADNISATARDGVLEVTVPRVPEVQPKKVPISIDVKASGAGDTTTEDSTAPAAAQHAEQKAS